MPEQKLRRCAACRKESPVSEMTTCMHNQMHRYVCDSKCMHDFYNPPKNAPVQQPASVAVPANEIRKVVTDAMVSMVAGVTGLVPPSDPGAIPDFVQAPIDRAVTQITQLLAAARRPVSVPESMLAAAASEMDRLGYGHHESHAQSILIAAGALHPVSGEQKAVTLRFPTMLRKMWSGGEVQGWLDRQGSLYSAPPAAQDLMELRLCEQKHTVLKPGVAYWFTVDPNCAACVELDSAHRAHQGEQQP